MNKRYPFYLIIYSFLLITLNLFAGTTGKIVGTVIDAENGEPLPGMNIIIENSTMGAASDIDGNYLINNIPPGRYTITCSGVGFAKKSYANVKVSADFTTKIDFKLSTDVISVETVVVEAKTPMVREDLTSSYTQIDAEQIENLPVESISQILTLQAGVTQGVGGELHIRGGRSNEIAYSVNGVSISNPYNNSRTVSVATNAIQELSVVSGTFNAEYGNALSGIVNTVTKEGGSDYHGSFSVYTGDFLSTHDDIFYDIDDIDPFNDVTTEMTLSGPIPMLENKVSFFLSGRMNNDKGYLNGIRQHVITDSVTKDPFNVSANGDNAIVSMNSGDSYSTTGKLTFKPTSTLKINIDALYSHSKYQTYNHDLKYNPDANNTTRTWGLLNILEIRHAVSNSTFYTLRGSYNIDDSKRYLFPLIDSYGNEVDDFYAGKSLEGLRPDPRYQADYKSTTRSAPVSFSSGGTYEGGSQSHSYQRTKIFGAKFDLTSQLSRQHELKFGGQFRGYKIATHYFEILRDTVNYLQPVIASDKSLSNNSYSKDPFEFSCYIQDKMEFESFIINVGLRYDYFNAQSQYSTNILFPTPNQTTIPSSIDKSSLLADAEAKQHLSPRVGVSFPITDKGIIHFSYGHFFQLPPLTYLFSNSEFKFSYGSPTYGNANLNPEKTVSYEIGLQQQLSESVAFNITGYYKDVRDLLARQQIRVSGDQTYFTFVNKDYANIKGIVFSLVKKRLPNDLFGFTLDYTFQTAEGNEVNSDAFFLDLSSGRQSEKIPVYLGWDKTHQLNATMSMGESGNWNITLVGKLGTGLPYTPQLFEKQIYLRPNSGRRPAITNVDLLAEKSFDLFGIEATAFMKIFNVFDVLNENIVFSSTGRSSYTLDELRGPAQETNKLSEIVPEIRPANEVYTNPAYYLRPRQVRFGVALSF